MTEENEEDFENDNICKFCKKETLSDKNRYHCLLTGRYRGPTDQKCNNNVTQDQNSFIPFFFLISATMIVTYFLKRKFKK